jgi:flagellar basal-body rod modification protein FlgD
MATTDGVTGTTASDVLTSSPNQVTRTTGGSLGKDDFLKLLVGQMKNMDPLSQDSKDPSESMAQMTQFSMLEQITNLNQSTQALTQQTKASSAVQLIGHTVSYTKDDGTSVEGKVESVQTAGGKVSLTIDGAAGIDPDKVLEVK